MTVYFRRKKYYPLSRMLINDRTLYIVQHFEFSGSTMSNNLKWELNIDIIIKKTQLRLYFLRRFRSFGLTTQIMVMVIFQSQHVWIYHSEGIDHDWIEFKNCFQNNRRRPHQFWINISAAPIRKSHSHIPRFIPSSAWPIWSHST